MGGIELKVNEIEEDLAQVLAKATTNHYVARIQHFAAIF